MCDNTPVYICKYCGARTVYEDSLCNACWVITKTLHSFSKNPAGMRFVKELVAAVEKEAVDDARQDPNCLVQDKVLVQWVELGEGYSGYYDPGDPDDVEMLRFDVLVLEDGEWVDVGDASYCTLFPVNSSREQRDAGLRLIMDAVFPVLSEGQSIKKICERMSWISPKWLTEAISIGSNV